MASDDYSNGNFSSNLEDVVKAYKKFDGNQQRAAQYLGIPRTTYRHRLRRAINLGLFDQEQLKIFKLEQQVKYLKNQLDTARKNELKTQQVRENIFEIANTEPIDIYNWFELDHTKKDFTSSVIGVPSLALSDFHWGEVVDPAQVEYLNEYNLEVASRRFNAVIEKTIDILHNYLTYPDYPGIVVPKLGDMISGDIHNELTITNELPTMPVITDLFSHMIKGIERLADKFGKVFIPCVAGNHGRITNKPHAKDYVYLTYDWLLYSFLEKWFENDDRVKFKVASGQDLDYYIYDTRYRMSHGDQFKGGDGIIGPLGPLTRGDSKKRAWTSQVDRDYNVSIYGHFHRLIPLFHMIINGSLKGFDEYTLRNNFPYEPPRQALWLTNYRRGVNCVWPIQADQPGKSRDNQPNWVSFEES